MKKIISTALLSSALLTPFHASAVEQGFYLGGGYSELTLDTNNASSDADLDSLFVRGGIQLNEFLAAEARLGFGVGDDRINGVKAEIEDVYGVYLKAGLPTTVGLYPYALLGVTHAKIKLSAGGFSETESDSDIGYGIGVDYAFSHAVSAGLEYARLYDSGGEEIRGLSLGVNFKF